MSAREGLRIPIAAKILGAAASMLAFLLVVVFVSNRGIDRVGDQLTDLSRTVIPITDAVTAVASQALEQEINLARMIRLAQRPEPPLDQIEREKGQFEARGLRVDADLETALALARSAAESAFEESTRRRFARLSPRLEAIEDEHQEFHDLAASAIGLLEAGRPGEAQPLLARLQAESDDVERALESAATDLRAFTAEAANDGTEAEARLLGVTAALAGAATVVGLLYALLVTRSLVGPLRELLAAAAGVRAGRRDVEVRVASRDEVGSLAAAFNDMLGELRHKDKIKDTFGRYIDARVVDRLLDDPEAARQGGEKRIMTVAFADLHGFKAATEDLAPEARVALTNRYLTLMSAPVAEQHGILDKFVGTVVMSFWGPPFVGDDEHGRLACLAALEQVARVAEVENSLAEPLGRRPALDLHVGLATGPLVVGSVGSEAARSFTVLGDTVNMASRLKGAAAQYGVQVLISEETRAAAADALETRELDRVKVVGKDEPLRVFEPLGRKGELDANTLGRAEAYARGLEAYRGRRFEEAESCFAECLELDAADGPARVMSVRSRELRERPPAEGWDGVWQLTKK